MKACKAPSICSAKDDMLLSWYKAPTFSYHFIASKLGVTDLSFLLGGKTTAEDRRTVERHFPQQSLVMRESQL